jgi:3-deoxy-D-manno-octulosonic-acid transferase
MILYRLILAVTLPVLLLMAALRGPAGAVAERLGRVARPRQTGATRLWLHGASLGELTSARWVIVEMLKARPGLQVLVTCNTATARAMVAGWALPGVTAALAPVDTGGGARRVIARWQPAALVIVENELWPGRILAMQALGRPVLVIGARLSARSARRWGRAPRLIARILGALTWVSAQDSVSLDRLAALGLPASAQGPVLDLKARVPGPITAAPAPPGPAPRGQVLLAASTHDGEEATILRAFAAARSPGGFSHLILAPRHPDRGDAVAALIAAQGLAFGRRSRGDLPRADQPVFLADTLGEMALWFALAGTCLIGGSLAPKGGHTPYEPGRQGMALLHGPSVSNFAASFARLDAEGGALAVTADTLAEVLTTLNPARRAALATRAAEILTPEDDGSWIVGEVLSRAGL